MTPMVACGCAATAVNLWPISHWSGLLAINERALLRRRLRGIGYPARGTGGGPEVAHSMPPSFVEPALGRSFGIALSLCSQESPDSSAPTGRAVAKEPSESGALRRARRRHREGGACSPPTLTKGGPALFVPFARPQFVPNQSTGSSRRDWPLFGGSGRAARVG